MTGAEHYRKAEHLVDLASTTSGADDGEDALFVAMAQVHATLALAAATAHDTETGFAKIGEYGDSAVRE